MASGLILMFGPPQSGKGTYGRRLSRTLEIPYVSAGEAIRERLREDESWFGGRYSMEMHDRGEFCPPELVRALVEELVDGTPGTCILDGYPRNASQFSDLMEMGLPFCLVHLNVPDEDLVRRASGRRVCSECGEVFNFDNPNMQAGPDGRCTICDGEVVKRGDDDEETVRRRLAKYHAETAEVLDLCGGHANAVIAFRSTDDDVDEECDRLIDDLRVAGVL